MHAKSDSEVTSLDASTPPRSPRRPLYYVQSPSQHDVEKMSYASSPIGSPHHYHCSPVHHSRESSTTRFSASVKNPKNPSPWKKIPDNLEEDDEDDEEDDKKDSEQIAKFYIVCFIFSFILLFSLFCLILWGASQTYKPKIFMKSIVFQSFNIQGGNDHSGVPTDMLSLNSTVKLLYRNPATFFGVHVSSTPLDLYYYQLRLASGNMKEFYASRKSELNMVTAVQSKQVPLYGGVSSLNGIRSDNHRTVNVPLNLTFVVRSRAYVLGKLVKPKFYKNIRCSVTLRGDRLGKAINLKDLCVYD